MFTFYEENHPKVTPEYGLFLKKSHFFFFASVFVLFVCSFGFVIRTYLVSFRSSFLVSFRFRFFGFAIQSFFVPSDL